MHNNVAMALASIAETGKRPTTTDLLQLADRRYSYFDHIVPDGVATFIARLLSYSMPHTVLDPWAGMGFLPLAVRREFPAAHCMALCRMPTEAETLRLLEGADTVQIQVVEPLTYLAAASMKVDAVVSCLPWGRQTQRCFTLLSSDEDWSLHDEYGHLLLLESLRHLGQRGIGIFVVSSRFFVTVNKAKTITDFISRMGFSVAAAIELPAGTFSPVTGLTTHIVVIHREPQSLLFTASYSPDVRQQQIVLENFRSRRQGKSAAEGCLVAPHTFRGFTAVNIVEQMKELATRMGLQPIALSELISDIRVAKPGGRLNRN